MEELSVSVFWAALIATGTGVFFYWAYTFGSRLVLRRMATNGGPGRGGPPRQPRLEARTAEALVAAGVPRSCA